MGVRYAWDYLWNRLEVLYRNVCVRACVCTHKMLVDFRVEWMNGFNVLDVPENKLLSCKNERICLSSVFSFSLAKYKDHFSFLRDSKFLEDLENDSVDSDIIDEELSALQQVPIRSVTSGLILSLKNG